MADAGIRLSPWKGSGSTVIAVLLLLFVGSVYAEEYDFAPAGDWVRKARTPESNEQNIAKAQDGVEYLLVDRQARVVGKDHSYYGHYSSKALNGSGLEEIAHISIDFDPAYQRIVLHEITIHRDGQSIDMLDRTAINIIQLEKDLKYQIYDGTKTLNGFVEDVRRGDVLEYAFTVNGVNPVFNGHFATYWKTRWAVPVGRAHLRIVWPKSKPLEFKLQGETVPPEITDIGDFLEYRWQQDNTATLRVEDDLPDWYDPYMGIAFSDMQSWKEVIDWALPMYQSMPLTPELDGIVKSIMQKEETPLARTLAVLDFVQEEIRYLGIEMGVRSHKPSSPARVYEQRFGDCKDKSLLMVNMLNAMGIDASVALVHNSKGGLLINDLPSPKAFNHAIVYVALPGSRYWFDPTLSYQEGDTLNIYQPDYTYALVLNERKVKLEKMSHDIIGKHGKHAQETFDVSKLNKEPAKYSVETSYRRYYADKMRKYFSEENHSLVHEGYIDYFSGQYPGATSAAELGVENREKDNVMVVSEAYDIPKIWSKTDDDKYLYISFNPFLVKEYLEDRTTRKRKSPMSIGHPVSVAHSIKITVPKGLTVEDENTYILDSAFEFRKTIFQTGNEISVQYAYSSKKDHVLPEEVKEYNRNIEKATDMLYFEVSKLNVEEKPKSKSKSGKSFFDVLKSLVPPESQQTQSISGTE